MNKQLTDIACLMKCLAIFTQTMESLRDDAFSLGFTKLGEHLRWSCTELKNYMPPLTSEEK